MMRKKEFKSSHVRYHLAEWIGILALSAVITLILFQNYDAGLREFFLSYAWSLVLTATLWIGNSRIYQMLDKRFSWEDHLLKRAVFGSLALIVYSAGAYMLIQVIMFMLVEGSLPENPVAWGLRSSYVAILISFIVSLIFVAMGFFQNWKKSLLEAERIRLVFNAAWAENWGFVPLTGGEVGQMVKQLKSIVIPELVPVAEKDGEMIGFALTVPDLNQVLRSNRSGRLLPVLPKLLWSLWRRKFYRLRVLLLGVLPEYRSRGIDAMLWHWIWSRVARNGIRWGEAGWILEDNAAMKNATERMGFRRYKTYRLFDRPT